MTKSKIKNKRPNRKVSRRLVKAMENFSFRYESESRKEARWLVRANLFDHIKPKGRKRRHAVTVGIFARENFPEHGIEEGDLILGYCRDGKASIDSSVGAIT